MVRKIIHIDMDAFYTSIEQLDNPYLIGKPIVVGKDSERGVVAAASYESRVYGIKSAMPSTIAKTKNPNIIFIKPRFKRYKEISLKIRKIFFEYTDLVEPLSLDEAFLDVTKNKKNIFVATEIAKKIRFKIKKNIGLNASAGISINKFIAKIATEINKPNGQKTIHPKNVKTFLENLPIEKFFGIGIVTTKKMKNFGIYNGKDLKEKSLKFLNNNFGKSGSYFYEIVRGIQKDSVKPNKKRKSIGYEKTFSKDIKSESFIIEKLSIIASEVENKLINNNLLGKTVTIKIKYEDFYIQTRSKTLKIPFQKKEQFFPVIHELIFKKEISKSVRLLGITISNLSNRKNNIKDKKINFQYRFKF